MKVEPARGEEVDLALSPVVRTLDRLRAVSRVVVDELDRQQLAAALARQLQVLLAVESAVVALTDERSLLAVEKAGSPLPESALEAILLGVAQRREPWRSGEPAPAAAEQERALAAAGLRSLLAVPVLNHLGRSIGVLLVSNRRDGGLFGPAEARILDAVALQAAVGMERALLLDRLDDWTQGLQALLAFSAAINRHLDPPALVRHLVEHAARFLKASGGWAGLLSSEGTEGEPELATGEYWHGGTWRAFERRWRRGDGLAGFLLETEFPYLSNDYAEDRLADAALASEFGVRRALAVPIKGSDGGLLGFFELHRGADLPAFSWQEAGFLESLANTTAVAIENARLMAAVALKNEQIRTLSAHNVSRLEEERRYIARELHDEAGQALVGVKLALQVMARLAPNELPELRVQLDDLRDQVNDATLRIKDLAWRLRPPTLDELGLEVALRQLAAEYGHRAGFAVDFSFDAPVGRLPPTVETSLYRVVQEALTNVAAHGEAKRVEIRFTVEEHLAALRVADDGRGFEPQQPRQGLGLLGMRERVGMLGGTFVVDSAPGRGTRLHIEVPVDAASR